MMRFDEGIVSLKQMRVFARHGVLPQEQATGGEYVVSLSVRVDFSKAMLTDSIDDTVNYARLVQVVKDEMAIPSQLLEHVAGRIAKKVCGNFPNVDELWVEIEKVNPPLRTACKAASVKLHVTNDKT